MNSRIFAAAAFAAAACAAGAAQAHPGVQWQVSIGGPVGVVVGNAPVYAPAMPVYGQPVYAQPVYAEPAPVYAPPMAVVAPPVRYYGRPVAVVEPPVFVGPRRFLPPRWGRDGDWRGRHDERWDDRGHHGR